MSDWQPLLAGNDAARAWEAIDAIAAALAEPDSNGASLDRGSAGRALFFEYLARARADAGARSRSRELLDHAIDGVEALSADPSLYGGFCGVAWTVQHLLAPDQLDADPNSELDELLDELVGNWEGQFDLVSGLCGFGVYAWSRARHPLGRAILARVADKLEATAVMTAQGLAWHTRPQWLVPERRAGTPDGEHNLGLAHGAGGVVALLAAATAVAAREYGPASAEAERAHRLFAGATRFVLTPRLPLDSPSFLPATVEDPTPTRVAWCYGDLGVAAALFAGARLNGDAALARDALAMACRSAARSDDCGVRDAGVCHGAAGLGLIFHQLFHDSGDARLGSAARRWYRATLDDHRHAVRGGFAAWSPDGGYRADLSLVSGILGVGLALISAVAPVAPAWSSVLAIACP